MQKVGSHVASQLADVRLTRKLAKDDDDETSVDTGLIDAAVKSAVDDADWTPFTDVIKEDIERQFKLSGAYHAKNIDVSRIADMQALTDLIDKDAMDYAETRGAELVGKKWIDGELVDNPKAEWSILESTRDRLKGVIASAFTEGLPPRELAKVIEESFSFSESRSRMIAQTELAFATSDAHRKIYKETGAVGKYSVLSADHDDELDCDCEANEDEGVIPIDDDFGSGDESYPYHPNCWCTVVYVYPDDLEAEDLADDIADQASQDEEE